ncbi:ESX secretion-associated protein EspG [Mycobacterium sp. SMC-4]|uniref:ESX secretion-associated protein EspG n=1 Tax=Mycobacterium sp. SMC-4 TaxID=2857059 RepID=UPI0021B2DEBC|nr:ESX secretion-associated protein EspG [Mycobacterium sp. SMC-4]UXA18229.1 ESX secretion-associated protein EspG [Mycobacterium sp. SMC-4]
MTAGPFLGDGEPTHYDDVVGVELTIDGIQLIADLLHLVDFPLALAIRPNIPYEEQRAIVREHVTRDLTAQGVLTAFGDPHPEVAAMVDVLSRPDRTLDCRWWRRDVGGKMVRFVVCRKGERHVVAARDEDMLVLQRVAPQIGLAAMVNVVIGDAPAADVEPLTGLAHRLSGVRSADQLASYGQPPSSAKIYAEATATPTSWVEITANERHPGGTYSPAGVGAGVLDSAHGRIVSLPRRVNGELYGSFLPGTPENLQRALDSLVEFLPSAEWSDHTAAGDCASANLPH